MGIVLGIADRFGSDDREIKQITLRDAVLMGVAQALALIPGVSRSGATISMGRFLGYEREAATRYAFLLAIPAVVGAGLFELKEIPGGDNAYGWGPTLVATVVSLRRRVRRHRLAAALRLHELLPAVRDLPRPARHGDAHPARDRRAVRLKVCSSRASASSWLIATTTTSAVSERS